MVIKENHTLNDEEISYCGNELSKLTKEVKAIKTDVGVLKESFRSFSRFIVWSGTILLLVNMIVLTTLLFK